MRVITTIFLFLVLFSKGISQDKTLTKNNYKVQQNIEEANKSIIVNAIVINDICSTLEAMIKRHLEVQEKAKCALNESDYFLLIRIGPFYPPYDVPSHITLSIDSLYNSNIFSKDTNTNKKFLPQGPVYVATVKSVFHLDFASAPYFRSDTKRYYFKYNDVKVLIIPWNLSISFNELEEKDIVILNSQKKDLYQEECFQSVYGTRYQFDKLFLQEIRFRDIIMYPSSDQGLPIEMFE